MTMAGEVTYSTLDFSQAGANTAAKPPGNCEDVTYSHVNFKTSTINQDGTPAAPSNGLKISETESKEHQFRKKILLMICLLFLGTVLTTIIYIFTKKAMTSTNDTSCKMVTELQDCQNKENKLNLNYQPNKIRLYLDHEKKQLSLCAMDNNSINAHIYTFEDINTSEKLFPIICTGDTKVITINPSSKT
ncbi:uncharacterized protein LOC120531462 isoform X2 [Polypterus senegalus]|uniref:uncharacterized protein LOC120531462 isoform X2 n=1 Tax=Polypterus senegalus TaxID=55291 RepID=UPI00196358A0|nr:uncharacterized protein LOC120531462 isoform X2 [Polypterus senegalus]